VRGFLSTKSAGLRLSSTRWEGSTATVRDHSSVLHFFQSKFLDHADDGMECASGFEGADFLVILAFEIEVDLGAGTTRVTRC
jgi:hypothetical protein